MIPPLYDHQKRIINEDRKKCGLFLGTGGAKTRTALELAEGSILVIAPKQQRDDHTWERNADKFGIVTNLLVISKEDMRRDWEFLERFDTVIIDECHTVLGATADTRQLKGKEIPKVSQIFDAVLNYLAKNPPDRLYLCSATPVSKPMNLWAIARLLGVKWDFFGFREKYYSSIRIGQRRIWLPKKDAGTKDEMARLVKHFGYVGSLNDFFDVPEQTHRVVEVPLSGEQEEALRKVSEEEADPLRKRGMSRTIENGILYGNRIESDGKTDRMVRNTILFKSYKIDRILDLAAEFPKLLVFANYTAQINEIVRALKEEGYAVSALTGKTKDRTFIKTVDESPDPHIVVAQSSISAGYELPSFPCVAYASKSWQFVHYEQSLGRVLRSNGLKKNLYVHLIVKGCDSDCHDSILSGSDFQERLRIDTETDTDYDDSS